MNMTDKAVLITGSSKGMGFAIAKEFAINHAKICIVARNKENLFSAKQSILKDCPNADIITVPGDVGEEEIPEKVFNICIKEFGKIDILVNNTGGPPAGSFLEHNESVWKLAINQNLMSAIRFCTLVAPIMKQNNWGRIINILSTVAKEPSSAMVLSATTRSGLSAFTKAIAFELAPYQITVNSILPGGVLTDRLYSLLSKGEQDTEDLESKIKESAKMIPIQRHAAPKEIADVVLFLASNKASYITGLNIPIDGGLTKGIF